MAKKLLIKNGEVHDAVNAEGYLSDILVEDGKIAKIAEGIRKSKDCEVFDAAGLRVYPGFVEAHCHIGLDGYAVGYEGKDYNEHNDSCTPQLRAIDSINPQDPTFLMAARAGVTTVCTGPGSANVLGGTFTCIKTTGDRVEKMIVRDPVAMKCAFGENPKRVYRDKCISARMTVAAKLREMLFKAVEYKAKKDAAGEDISKRPAFDMKMEALIPVLERKIPLKAHAHRADDIFTAIRIAKEFNVRLTLDHVTDGSLIANDLAEEGFPCAVGPSLTHATKVELTNKSFKTAGDLSKAGASVSIITDSPVIPEQYLPLCAGLAVKDGMDPFEALKAITINAAKHIGVEDRVGSIEAGKDADFVITAGDPLESATCVEAVFINGERV
ncbi:MAG: amidohydrolase [Lachnospiraceae bacterium]|nr:amidohydrolase [Lachnospiraceae bacterium]